ncbi:hypothetical protein LCGC14_0549840 [marine sediment metagenome]|uniref:Uncharacterized protein n=1 Tax=marine sediment metagenome TaxID=412755 RepID=A0A0F9S8S8_9ZZZZ
MRKKDLTIDTSALEGFRAKMKVRTSPTGMKIADITFETEKE